MNMVWIEGNWYVLERYRDLEMPKYWYLENNGLFEAGADQPKFKARAEKYQPNDPYLTSVFEYKEECSENFV